MVQRANATDLMKEVAPIRHASFYCSETPKDIFSSYRANGFSHPNIFQQYQLGLLPEDVWNQVESRINAQYSNCALRSYFNGVIPAFRDNLSKLPNNCSE